MIIQVCGCNDKKYCLKGFDMIATSDFRKGARILFRGDPWIIVDFAHVKPGKGGQFQDTKERMAPLENQDRIANQEATSLHARNFLDCIKSGQECNADIEIGHRSTSCAHLGNIALQVGRVLEWDAENEKITNVPDANDLLHYEYRAPWKLR